MAEKKIQPNDSLPNGNYRFGIIQLSDLQFGKNHRFGCPSKIAEKLLIDIKNISEEYKFIPSYIILSGDIVETGAPEEFHDAEKVIKKLSDGLGIDKTKILCIPGNHDVNFELSKSGDNQLAFKSYNDFLTNIKLSGQSTANITYPLKKDTLLITKDELVNIEFLLLNSCEKIDQNNNSAWIQKEKLIATLTTKKENGAIRIAISHHLLNASAEDELTQTLRTKRRKKTSVPAQLLQKRLDAIKNMKDIKSIIENHKCDIVLTGHIHEPYLEASINDVGHNIIYSCCGSTGVNKKYREDGIQNQYCVHVIDVNSNQFVSIWRAYNPLLPTEHGKGGWTKDTSFPINPTELPLPIIIQKSLIQLPEQKASSSKRKRSTCPKPKKKISKKYATYLAIASLLGAWNEKAKK